MDSKPRETRPALPPHPPMPTIGDLEAELPDIPDNSFTVSVSGYEEGPRVSLTCNFRTDIKDVLFMLSAGIHCLIDYASNAIETFPKDEQDALNELFADYLENKPETDESATVSRKD